MSWNCCCVPGCGVSKKSIPPRSFHKLPHDVKLFRTWVTIIHREDLLSTDKGKLVKFRICSDHFSDEQFGSTCTPSGIKGRRLRKFAIPDIVPGCISEIGPECVDMCDPDSWLPTCDG